MVTGTIRRITVMIFFLIAANCAFADILAFTSASWYNKGFHDDRYLDRSRISLAVPMTTLGTEVDFRLTENTRAGAGTVTSSIGSGKKYNYDHYEVQNQVFILLPYVFGGYDFDFLSVDLGVSAYYYFMDTDKRGYYTGNGGNFETADKAGFNLDRQLSHVFMNMKVRLFPEEGFHIKLRFGRENFVPVDSILNLCLVMPISPRHALDLSVSSTGVGSYLISEKFVLRSNQVAAFRYQFSPAQFRIGTTVTAVMGNTHGRGGSIDPLNRFGLSLDFSTRW